MSNPFMHSPEQDSGLYSNGHCLKVGVLTNPRSGGNRKGGRGVHKLLERWPEVMHRETSDPEDVSEALSDFSRNGVDQMADDSEGSFLTIGVMHMGLHFNRCRLGTDHGSGNKEAPTTDLTRQNGIGNV